MSSYRLLFLVPILVLMVRAAGVAACGGSADPEPPDTTAASVLSYLEEVDYQESWEL